MHHIYMDHVYVDHIYMDHPYMDHIYLEHIEAAERTTARPLFSNRCLWDAWQRLRSGLGCLLGDLGRRLAVTWGAFGVAWDDLECLWSDLGRPGTPLG